MHWQMDMEMAMICYDEEYGLCRSRGHDDKKQEEDADDWATKPTSYGKYHLEL